MMNRSAFQGLRIHRNESSGRSGSSSFGWRLGSLRPFPTGRALASASSKSSRDSSTCPARLAPDDASPACLSEQDTYNTDCMKNVSKTDAHGNNGIAAKSVLGGSPIHMDRLNQGLALGVSLMFCLASMCFFIARQMFVSEQCILECAGADIPYGV